MIVIGQPISAADHAMASVLHAQRQWRVAGEVFR